MHHAALLLALLTAATLASPAVRSAEQELTAPAVQVVRVDFGVFERAADGRASFRSTNSVPLVVGQSYGWVARVKTSSKSVRVREELTLPREPKTWGDPELGLKQRVSKDGRTATTEVKLPHVNGVIAQSWAVAPGDPTGTYTVKIWIENDPPRTVSFQVQ